MKIIYEHIGKILWCNFHQIRREFRLKALDCPKRTEISYLIKQEENTMLLQLFVMNCTIVSNRITISNQKKVWLFILSNIELGE